MLSAPDIARQLAERGVALAVAAGCAARVSGGFAEEVGGDTRTYFDLASLTKSMTAIALARSGLGLERSLESVLPEMAGTASARATMLDLLSHRAGLAPHVPLYAPLVSGSPVEARTALREAANARRAGCDGPVPAGGFPAVYSDVGYMLAGAALARHCGVADAGHVIDRLVAAPLGLSSALGTAESLATAGVDLTASAAPTEEVPWRGGIVRGLVHDENAWALTGSGGSGHAGMFSTLGAMMVFASAVLEGVTGRGPLADAQVGELIRPRPGGTLRAGFDGKSEQGSSAGASFGPRSFGHLGFTGTSFWIDPDAAVVVVLLTNRVHPTRENASIKAARPWAHEALFQRALRLASRP